MGAGSIAASNALWWGAGEKQEACVARWPAPHVNFTPYLLDSSLCWVVTQDTTGSRRAELGNHQGLRFVEWFLSCFPFIAVAMH